MGHKLRCMGSITEPGLSPDPLQASHRHLSPAAPLEWDFFFQNREELQLGIAAQQEDGCFAQSCLQTMMREEILSPSVRIKPFLEKCNYR